MVPGADPQFVAPAPAAVFHDAVAPTTAQLPIIANEFDDANVKDIGTQQVVPVGAVAP